MFHIASYVFAIFTCCIITDIYQNNQKKFAFGSTFGEEKETSDKKSGKKKKLKKGNPITGRLDKLKVCMVAITQHVGVFLFIVS